MVETHAQAINEEDAHRSGVFIALAPWVPFTFTIIAEHGTLASVPFTEQYAREEMPRDLWSSPKFKSVNRNLTLMWGTVFAAMASFHMAAGAIDTRPTNIVLNWVIPIGLVLWGIKQTSVITEKEEA
jgi:hypothetical protein